MATKTKETSAADTAADTAADKRPSEKKLTEKKLTEKKLTQTKTTEKSAKTTQASTQKAQKQESAQKSTQKRQTRKKQTPEAEATQATLSELMDSNVGSNAAPESVAPEDVISEGVASKSLVNTEAPSASSRFLAADCMTDNIWAPNTAIPTLDEATYTSQKAQAEAQRRAIEIATLNLQNINDLHKLERQSLDVAISAKTNETRSAQLAGTEIDYQTQLEVNGEKSQQLMQASAKHKAAARETDYVDQLISLKDQNFELDIQQAQTVFAEKAARYRAQLTGK